MHHMVSPDISIAGVSERDKRPSTFPCPTCRSVITVPPGGVEQFQTNFYLNERIPTCEVCDGGKEAKYKCTNCGHNMCAKCQRCHAKFFTDHEVQPIASRCQQSPQQSLDPLNKETIADHIKVLEAALVTMGDEKVSLQRERQEVADVITKRAEALRALVTQAEECSQRALADWTKKLDEEIQAEMTFVRDRYCKIWQLSPQGGDKGQAAVTHRHKQTVLLSDYELNHYQQRGSKGREAKIIQHQYKDCAIDLQAVEAYIGTVWANSEPTGETSSLVSPLVYSETNAAERCGSDVHTASQTSDTTQLTQDLADIKHKVKTLELLVDSGSQHLNETELKGFKEESSKLKISLTALKEEVTKIQQTIVSFKGDMSSMQKNMIKMQEDLRVDNTGLKKDIATIKKDTTLLQKRNKSFHDDLSKDLKSFKENSSITVAFNGVLKEDREISRTRETLIMNVEKCNVGQAYDEETGVFTAPVTGTYFFLARALKAKGPEFCGLIITVDGSEATRSKSHDGELQAGVGCSLCT
ncbi:hypothetical protein C0Q70_11328 [Pomacea canaliculata]|uniref:C1q domain-containing protein n=2 Tax=Pomacea canaliculata TaxID=400727 RepID=A0A2T7P5N3_POMCA|nr:hypothetical protein C0Q70_11328 [Pomacea canaliculata]